jgi:hypothetical protein
VTGPFSYQDLSLASLYKSVRQVNPYCESIRTLKSAGQLETSAPTIDKFYSLLTTYSPLQNRLHPFAWTQTVLLRLDGRDPLPTSNYIWSSARQLRKDVVNTSCFAEVT